MDPALFAFIVVLTTLTAAIWLRLVRMILRGQWPPIGLRPEGPALRAPAPPRPAQHRSESPP